jgi:hypothetical protein
MSGGEAVKGIGMEHTRLRKPLCSQLETTDPGVPVSLTAALGRLRPVARGSQGDEDHCSAPPRHSRPAKGQRPGRSQHQALDALPYALVKRKVNYVLDADIQGFFDNLDKAWMIKFVEHRVVHGAKSEIPAISLSPSQGDGIVKVIEGTTRPAQWSCSKIDHVGTEGLNGRGRRIVL